MTLSWVGSRVLAPGTHSSLLMAKLDLVKGALPYIVHEHLGRQILTCTAEQMPQNLFPHSCEVDRSG